MKNFLFLLIFCVYYNTLQASQNSDIISIHTMPINSSHIRYTKCYDSLLFEFEKFPLALSSTTVSNSCPCIPETFILSIPNGRVQYQKTVVPADNHILTILANGHIIKELIWRWSPLQNKDNMLKLKNLPNLERIQGTVAVIAQEGHNNYYHWMTEVLPKLALLEDKKINYDWLYVPCWSLFQEQTLLSAGINPKKIVTPAEYPHLQANELIVPSAVSLSCYTPLWVVNYLRTKFIPLARKAPGGKIFGKKIFISRQNAPYRKIINEDEIFAKFKELGFKRYILENLSFLDQVSLFNNANIIVGAHGAGLTNLIFAKQKIPVIEIFQEREDDTFWYLSQTIGLKHECIKTTEFKKDLGHTDTIVPLNVIEPIIERLKKDANLIPIA